MKKTKNQIKINTLINENGEIIFNIECTEDISFDKYEPSDIEIICTIQNGKIINDESITALKNHKTKKDGTKIISFKQNFHNERFNDWNNIKKWLNYNRSIFFEPDQIPTNIKFDIYSEGILIYSEVLKVNQEVLEKETYCYKVNEDVLSQEREMEQKQIDYINYLITDAVNNMLMRRHETPERRNPLL